MSLSVWARTRTYMRAYVCVCVYMYTFFVVFMYLFINFLMRKNTRVINILPLLKVKAI